MTFKLFQTWPETRRNALMYFTKPLPKSERFRAFADDRAQNQPDKSQYLSKGRQNQNGPKQRANAARP